MACRSRTQYSEVTPQIDGAAYGLGRRSPVRRSSLAGWCEPVRGEDRTVFDVSGDAGALLTAPFIADTDPMCLDQLPSCVSQAPLRGNDVFVESDICLDPLLKGTLTHAEGASRGVSAMRTTGRAVEQGFNPWLVRPASSSKRSVTTDEVAQSMRTRLCRERHLLQLTALVSAQAPPPPRPSRGLGHALDRSPKRL